MEGDESGDGLQKAQCAEITMALPCRAAKGDYSLLKARHLRFQPGMSAGRAAQSFRGTSRDGLPLTIC